MFFFKRLLRLFFLVSFCASAQELPPINTYSPKEYGAESQNWSISQADNKFIYVANNKGLLEFNGENWKLYATPNETIMRSVKAFKEVIYTGFYMDFGFWSKTPFGSLTYTSISKDLKIPLLEDENFWNIIELDGWMLFQSLQRIYLYNIKTQAYKIIPSSSKIVKMVKVNDTIYFQKQGIGVFKIENGEAVLVSNHAILKNNDLVNIYLKDKKLVFLTQEKGFFILDNNQLFLWDIPANKKIQNNSVYSSIQLKNGDYVLGTIANGFIHLTKDGILNYHIAQNNGLSNNTVLAIFEDTHQNIWLALDNGINSINMSSAFRVYTNKSGSLGTVYTSIIDNGIIYLGTNQGLFYKPENANTDFTFIENTQGQVWRLLKIGNEIFCGHNTGTFIIKENQATKIANVPGTWDIKFLSRNRYLQGNYDGLYVLEKIKGTWNLRNKIEGFDISSRFFEVENSNTIFVNHEYKGVFKLKVNDNHNKVTSIEKVASVKKGIHSSILKYQDKILYASKKGVYTYNKTKDEFLKDTILSSFYSENTYSSGRLIYNAYSNLLWGFSKGNLHYVSAGKLSNTPTLNAISISNSLDLGATGFENIAHIKDQKYLIGSSNGYNIVNLDNIIKSSPFTVFLNSVKNGIPNETLFDIALDKKGNFNNNQNHIEFSFNVPNYHRFSVTEYQYQLVGHNNTWSKWSKDSKVFFENLPSGDFTFKVKAKIENRYSENIASFNFSIHKKWYWSHAMIALYVLTIVLLSLFTHINYKRYYKRQQEKLLEKTQKDLELKELETQQEMMRLRNEKLRSDIQSKNKELATSTMSIIKKNEFLNTLKKELQNSDAQNIKKVLTIIDKNLNNTDDWKMFQEAFNNADKDFLKKIKKIHPTLTPNDLRLCAYLRLNLSSKEIAPLLNISPRSVEVKRYRLRKKMNLAHESSLTNYILEI